jgi:hypothetical protein
MQFSDLNIDSVAVGFQNVFSFGDLIADPFLVGCESLYSQASEVGNVDEENLAAFECAVGVWRVLLRRGGNEA